MKILWKDFDHQLRRNLEEQGLLSFLKLSRVCVAFSGGVDSVALLQALWRQKQNLKMDLSAAHFHHGAGSNLLFRNRSLKFCQKMCDDLGIELFWTRYEGPKLVSEAEFRESRWNWLFSLKTKKDIQSLVTGHHAEDQLETRVLHLVRGCGPEGLQAMSYQDGPILRPFLNLPKAELRQYLQDLKVRYVEDPSNSNTKYKRNWLREKWLPELESKQQGSLKSLAASLEKISVAFQQQSEAASTLVWYQGDWQKGIDRRQFYCLNSSQQKQAVVNYLRLIGTHDFRHTQIQEIIKNLDSSKIVHRFSVLRLHWQVNAEQILASKS